MAYNRTGNIFIAIMADFELFFLPFKAKFNKYAQIMVGGRKAFMPCVEDMMLLSPAMGFGQVALLEAAALAY